MADIVTTKSNCTENAGSTYSTSGVPLTTATVFTKTFTVATDYVFKTEPSINFSRVSDPNSYSVTITDTGSVAGGNLTVRSFAVKYKYPLTAVTGDVISFVARAEVDEVNSTGKIYNYIFDVSNVRKQGETRTIKIYGDDGATLTFDAKYANNSSMRGGSGTVTIPTGGLYEENIIFPSVSASTTYSVVLTQIASNSFLNISTPTTLSLNQYVDPTITFNFIESASDFLVRQSNVTITDSVGSKQRLKAKFEWYVTSQSSSISLKNVGDFTASDFTGTTSANVINTLTGGTIVEFDDLQRTIHATTTAATGSSATTNTTITLAAANADIYEGMRVTGSGITASGTGSCIVTNNNGEGVITVSQTPGGTISGGTTLTFHSVMVVSGNVTINEMGTSSQTCSLDAADIVAFNAAPTATSQANVAVTVDVPKEITLAGSDTEGDTLTFTVLSLPSHGTFAYSNASNQATTVSCSGQTGQTIVLGNSKVVTYTSASGDTTNTSFTFKVNDGQQDSSTATVGLTISS